LVTQVKHLFFFFFFFLFHSMQHKVYGTDSASCISPDNLLELCTNFSHLGAVLIIYYKCMHLNYSLQSSCSPVFLHISFLCCSTFSYRCLLQQQRCFIAAHNLQHFQTRIQEPV
jgi:hypothetical protein